MKVSVGYHQNVEHSFTSKTSCHSL